MKTIIYIPFAIWLLFMCFIHYNGIHKSNTVYDEILINYNNGNSDTIRFTYQNKGFYKMNHHNYKLINTLKSNYLLIEGDFQDRNYSSILAVDIKKFKILKNESNLDRN